MGPNLEEVLDILDRDFDVPENCEETLLENHADEGVSAPDEVQAAQVWWVDSRYKEMYGNL